MDMNLHTGFADRVDHRADAPVFDNVPRADRLPLASTAVSRLAKAQPAEIGSSWYHEAAIEADRRDLADARSNPYHH